MRGQGRRRNQEISGNGMRNGSGQGRGRQMQNNQACQGNGSGFGNGAGRGKANNRVFTA
ncbi:MAG: hypothetical protein U9N30_01935 [Campylobacterota bacterium]|nr:hypothetical protein [Campylobacterota bacterium]